MRNYLMNSVANKLESFALHCPEDLMPGATLVYDGKNWRIGKVECCEDATNNAEVEKQKEKVKELENTIKELNEKIKELEANETSLEKWIDVEFNGETEKTVSDDFITADSVVDFVFLNGNPTTDPMTSVEAGSVTVSFEEAQTGTIRLQITKKK